MEKQDVNAKKYYTIDLLHIVKFLLQKVWIILLAALIAGGIGFGISAFLIKPTYSSTIMLYVNNSSLQLGGASVSISSGDITASQSLVKTYGQLLGNRTTYQQVIDAAGVDYTPDELAKMIKSGAANDTEIMYVTVTTNDPYEASKIANCIAEVLPKRIDQIIDTASMTVVDSAVPDLEKVGPSITKYTAVGLLLGLLGSVAVLAVVAMTDDRIHDENYIIENYQYPILAKVPNLVDNDDKKKKYRNYYYYSKSKRYGDYVSNEPSDKAEESAESNE